MSTKQRKILWPVLFSVLVCAGALVFVAARPGSQINRSETSVAQITANSSLAQRAATTQRKGNSPRNLMRQPEAFNLSRRLGRRFASDKREQSALVGTLTIGSERRVVQITRTQTDDGEEIEIRIAGSSGALTWDRERGATLPNGPAIGSDRELIERLAFDSPDQFVLAQLHGASYYTIARNVRSAEASDGYSGPTWTIVRVDDRAANQNSQSESPWRLYYLNTATGLIDRIVGEVNGQQIVAELTWMESGGEKVPSQIVWTRQGRVVMKYSLTNFAHADQGGAR